MVAVAMVTKMPKMLNSLQASQSFAVMFPVTSTFKFAAVAMEIKKKGGILKIF
jgi:hypothetical protein